MDHSFQSSLLKKGHAPLVEWWYYQNPIISTTALDSSSTICKKLDKQWSSHEFTCGFEFHHYDNHRDPDFLVFGETSELNNCPDLDLPFWWNKYERNISNVRESISSKDKKYSILSENWLEFDMIDSDLSLVGIWQAIQNNSFCNIDDWFELSEALSFSFLSNHSLKNSSQIKDFVRYFSLPSQIGLMYKRNSKVKLMAHLTSQESLDKLIPYLNTFDDSTSSKLHYIFSSLQQIGPTLRPALSIDIDLETPHKNPLVSIEIHQKKQIGRELLPETKIFLEEVCKIEKNQMNSLERILRHLPSGSRYTSTDPSNPFKNQIRIARLNHLKISFSQEIDKLKSYVRLVEQNI